ncbi:putative reverse transcriptase domain-containing protein [Tanacetum coccineum]
MHEVILFYSGLEVLTRQILDSKGAIPTKTAADAKVAIQEMAEYSQKWHNGTSRTRSTKTSNGLAAIQAQLNNLGREIKKVNEKVYAAQVGCEQWQYRAEAPGFYQRNNANPSYQERRQLMKESLSKFMNESAKRHEENSNMIKEIRASIDAAIRNQRAWIKTLDHVKSISTTVEADMTPIRRIGSSQYAVSAQQSSKLIFETRQVTIPFSRRLNDYCCVEKKGLYGPQYLDAYSYGATRIDDSLPRKEKDPGSFTLPYRTVNHPKGIAENVLVGIGKFVFPVDFIILDMPEDVKVPLILERPFLSIAHAKIDVFKRKITLRVGEEKIIFKSVKPASSLIKRVYMLSLRERMELDLEARLMGETFVLNRSLDPLYRDYIELNDLNVPLKLRRDQVVDLMPNIMEGEVVDKPMIEEFKAMNDKMTSRIIGYPNDYDEDEKICIDYAYNLKFSCMIGFEFVHANFFLNFPINFMSKKFYNSIMKDTIEFRRRNELGNFANVPVFIENFYVITDFTVVKDMDPYLDEGMGDVVVGEPFCKVSCVETRRFDGIITIHDEDNSVTYQMVRSNLRFKHLTNEQCNKIPPLLKVSEHDKMNRISHPYQKLKGFYKGVLNLELDFIRDPNMEEWLTRGHISVHEIE